MPGAFAKTKKATNILRPAIDVTFDKSLYVDKTQMERLEAVERSLAKRADQYGRKGFFFCDCASLTKHERLVDAEMALFAKKLRVFRRVVITFLFVHITPCFYALSDLL